MDIHLCQPSKPWTNCTLSFKQSTRRVSPVWTLRWHFKFTDWEKPFLQTLEGSLSSLNSHVTFQIDRLKKIFVTTEHLNGLSAVWNLMWHSNRWGWLKPFSQTEHSKGLSAVWTLMWVFKDQDRLKPFLQQSTWRVSLQCGLSCESPKYETE